MTQSAYAQLSAGPLCKQLQASASHHRAQLASLHQHAQTSLIRLQLELVLHYQHARSWAVQQRLKLAPLQQRALSWVAHERLQLMAHLQHASASAAYQRVSTSSARLRLKAAAAYQGLKSAASKHWRAAQLRLRSSAAWQQLLLTIQRLVLALQGAAEHLRALFGAPQSSTSRPEALPEAGPNPTATAPRSPELTAVAKPAQLPARINLAPASAAPITLTSLLGRKPGSSKPSAAGKSTVAAVPDIRPALPASIRLQAYWRQLHLRLPNPVARLAATSKTDLMQAEAAQHDEHLTTIWAVLAAATGVGGAAIVLYAMLSAGNGGELPPSSTPAVGGRVRWVNAASCGWVNAASRG
jgi:hypothetical protein